ncbi:MAG: nucleotidyltransferase domain-containing protein [Oceanospirillaceae bacterium]|nr:nucleotidyltransferase domain-containing protein [Oceanospirillaceae bacterium]
MNKFEVQTKLLDQIYRLANANDDIEVLWLYGSRAKDSFHDSSDYDLAVAFKDFTLSVSDRYLRPNLLAMEWACELGVEESMLSIIDINTSPVYLTFNVIEYGKVVYQEPTMRRVIEHNRIYSQYEFQMIENRQNA